MHLFFDIPPTHFRSFSLIVSLPLFHLMPLPHSLPMYLSQTTTIYLLLNLPFTLRIAVILLSFLDIYLSISLAFSLFGATSYHTSLYLCDIVPLLPPLLLSNLSVFFTLSPCLSSWQTLNLFLFLPVFFPPYRSFSLTHTYNSLSLSLSHSLLFSAARSVSYSVSHSLNHNLSLSISLSFSLSYLCLSFAQSSPSSLLSLTVSHSLSISLSLSLS